MTKFEKFLTNRGALEKFENSYRSTSSNRYTCEDFINHFGSSEFAIRSSFTWSNTPQGYDFWKNLSFEWVESLTNNTL